MTTNDAEKINRAPADSGSPVYFISGWLLTAAAFRILISSRSLTAAALCILFSAVR
jgi:hypothetical protein